MFAQDGREQPGVMEGSSQDGRRLGTARRSNMYRGAKTWSVVKGCSFDCVYCKPSFQLQSKRQKHVCQRCYTFEPHVHPERLDPKRIPSAPIVFVGGNGDLSFCPPEYLMRIIDGIREHGAKHPNKVFYLQSKRPESFEPFLGLLPQSVVLVTTLETNRDKGYGAISKAPPPTERYRQFLALDYPRKVVTIEPVMDFDIDVFANMIVDIKPEYVWLGLNSKPESVQLPESSTDKLSAITRLLTEAGIPIRAKDLRGLDLGLKAA
jgi:hypothetical protein